MNFSVRLACFDVETLSDDLCAVCNHATDAGIGGSRKPPKLCQLEGRFASFGYQVRKTWFQTALFGFTFGDDLGEFGNVFKAFIDRSETDISDLVDFGQLFHRHFADDARSDFFLPKR